MTTFHEPAPSLEADRLVARDGVGLPLRRWLPAGQPPRASVLALHGFNDYANAFATTGPALAGQGIATYAYDQRGFGRSPGRGHWPGAGRLVEDAVTAIGLLRAAAPERPLYLLGESMGAAVAILAANRGFAPASAPDGLILVAPAVWGRETMSAAARLGLRLADFVPAMRWTPRALPISFEPTDNQAVLEALRSDPVVIRGTRSDTLIGLIDLMGEALNAAPRLDATALILHGANDRIVPLHPVARFVSALPSTAKERQRVAFYGGGYHLLLRDHAGPVVTADILAWMADGKAALPSGADRDGRARLIAHAGRKRRAKTIFRSWRRAF